MATGSQLMTAAELLELPSGSARYEFVNGDLITRPLLNMRHSSIRMNLLHNLFNYIEAQPIGKVIAGGSGFMIKMDPDTVFDPDAAFVTNERATLVKPGESGYFPGPPDLAIEVHSPSDNTAKIAAKTARWLLAAVVW